MTTLAQVQQRKKEIGDQIQQLTTAINILMVESMELQGMEKILREQEATHA